MTFKEFLKPNKGKYIFSSVFIAVTLLVFVSGDLANTGKIILPFDSSLLTVIFVVLYFPALAFAGALHFLPVFRSCSVTRGQEICVYDQTIPLILSVAVFIVYAYLLSCCVFFLIGKNKNK